MREVVKTVLYWVGVLFVVASILSLFTALRLFQAGSWAGLVGVAVFYYYPIFGIIGGLMTYAKRKSVFDYVLILLAFVQVVLIMLIPSLSSVQITMNLPTLIISLIPPAILVLKPVRW